MTYQINTIEILIYFLKKIFKTRTLTGSTDKQNSKIPIKILSDLLVDISDETLHILTTFK